MDFIHVIGIFGVLLAFIGYVPQLSHLIKYKCPAKVDTSMYGIWAISSTLLLIHAIGIKTLIFTIVQIGNLVVVIIIYFLSQLYKTNRCKQHSETKIT